MARQLIPAYVFRNVAATSTDFGIFTADSFDGGGTGQCQASMPTGGTFKKLRVKLSTPPGSGCSWTIALSVGGSASALAVTISDAATEGTIEADVAVSAGDLVRYLLTKSGSASALNFIAMLEFEPTTAGDFVYGFRDRAGWGATGYSAAIYGQGFALATDALQTIMHAGTITRMDINMADGGGAHTTTPGAGNTITYTIQLNGVDQDGTAGTPDTVLSFTGSTNTGTKSFSLSVSEGDIVRIKCVTSGTPNVLPPAGTLLIQSDAQMFATCGIGNGISNAGTAYQWIVGSRPSGAGSTYFWASEAAKQLVASSPFTVTGIIMGVPSGTLTAGESVTVTLRQNGADTAITATITNPSLTASASGSVAINQGDLIDLAGDSDTSGPAVFVTLIGAGATTAKTGCFVAGVNTTVNATRSAAFGLDGDTNTQSTIGELAVFGKFRVTGTVTFISSAVSGILDVIGSTLGDVLYRGSSVWSRLAGNTSTTKKFLSQTGTGSVSAAPAWAQVADADLAVSDITTNNVTTSAHGFAPKAPNDATKFLDGTGAWSVPSGSSAAHRAVGITIDGAGSVVTTGVKGFVTVPFAGTIVSATLLSTDASATAGSIVIDIWKDTYANYPPTVADTIVASAPPTLSSANSSQDSTLTGWTTSITAGDVLGFNVNSASTVTRVTLMLEIAI